MQNLQAYGTPLLSAISGRTLYEAANAGVSKVGLLNLARTDRITSIFNYAASHLPAYSFAISLALISAIVIGTRRESLFTRRESLFKKERVEGEFVNQFNPQKFVRLLVYSVLISQAVSLALGISRGALTKAPAAPTV